MHEASTIDVLTRHLVRGDYLLRVTPTQLALLLCFSSGGTTRTLERLAQATQMHIHPLAVALRSLIAAGVLTCPGMAWPETCAALAPPPSTAAAHSPLDSARTIERREAAPLEPALVAAAAADALGLSAANAIVRLESSWAPPSSWLGPDSSDGSEQTALPLYRWPRSPKCEASARAAGTLNARVAAARLARRPPKTRASSCRRRSCAT